MRMHDGRSRPSGGWWPVRAVCHAGLSEPPKGGSLHLTDSDRGGIAVSCKGGGCSDQKAIRHALQDATGLPICRCRDCYLARSSGRRPPVERRPPPAENAVHSRRSAPESDRISYARSCWQSAVPIPDNPQHPARQWLWHRTASAPGPSLWWPTVAPPSAVRFLARFPLDGWPYGGPPPRCAAVLLALAPPSSWGESYPAPPVPSAVAANFVDGFGRPFKPPPWGKRFTLGVAKECAAIIGPPHPGPDGLILCEGLADGLAVAARRWDTVMVTSGIPPHNGAVFDYMGGWPTVTIFRDDEPEGRRATRICCDLLASRHGVNALVETAPKGFKDAAAWAESGEWDHLADLDAYAQDVDEIAADLSREGLNEWESRRRAAMCCAGAIPTSEPETRPATTPPEPVTTSTSTQGYFGGMPRRER